MEAVNGDKEDKGGMGGIPPPSPLTGCYLLIVIGEPQTQEHKDIILQKIAKGLLSWDKTDCLVDLEKELNVITEQGLEGEEARYGERLIQYASENLVTEILIHPAVSTLSQCVRNLLSSFTRHRHIIHAGYTFQANGSWALQDGTFSLADFSEAFQEIEVQRVIKAYENGISLDIHCSPEGDWTRLPKEPFTKACKVRVNPTDVLTTGSPPITNFINYISPFLIPTLLENILESSDVVGNIRFSRPTLYVFPGGQGDAALFGINGFNMLLDGGFSRKACFWDFVRHLDRLDAVLMTRLNNSSVSGISSVLRRKKQDAVYPQIGHFFGNIQERKSLLSPDGDKDKDPLIISLLEEGQDIISNLRHLHLTPQPCYRDSEPINLYHKVGHGTLNMYVLSPDKNSREVREFLQRWNQSDPKLFANSTSRGREFTFPLPNLVSICSLLVWQPANPSDTITRILYPGSSPQKKIFEGLDRLKALEFIKHPVCSEKSLAPVKKSKDVILDKNITSKLAEKKDKITLENKLIENGFKNGLINGDNIIKEKVVKKSDSTESEKSLKKKSVDETKTIENGEKVKTKPPRTDSKPATKPRSDSQHRKKPEKKASPSTPKKTADNNKVDGEIAEKKPIRKPSPGATPAKSTKDANNRKVIESKRTAAAVPKKEAAKPPAEAPKPKVERQPISRRPKAPKTPLSPVKKMTNGIQKPDSLPRKAKLDKEGTTDSSTVSTPSADQDSVMKKDISKLTPEELQEFKAQELADLKEEQEAVKEIEAVFRKSGEIVSGNVDENARKIKDISIEDKEEYLIIEKVEIEHDSIEAKEDETQKLARDSEESEKQRKLSAAESNTGILNDQPIEETKEEIQLEVTKSVEEAAQEDTKEELNEPTAGEVADEVEEVKEILESQPDEKISANVESGATTTAPTLPEDERIPLDEIKEDNGQVIIEEKHTKEDTKEKEQIPVIQLVPSASKPSDAAPSAKVPTVVGLRLDKQSHIRDIVKTPDEVADLPVHEEVDFNHYDEDKKSNEVDDGNKKTVDEKVDSFIKEQHEKLEEIKADVKLVGMVNGHDEEVQEQLDEILDDIDKVTDMQKELEELSHEDADGIDDKHKEETIVDKVDEILNEVQTDGPEEPADEKLLAAKDSEIPSDEKLKDVLIDSPEKTPDEKPLAEEKKSEIPSVEAVQTEQVKEAEQKITEIKEDKQHLQKLDDKLQELKEAVTTSPAPELKLDEEKPKMDKILDIKSPEEKKSDVHELNKIDEKLQALKEQTFDQIVHEQAKTIEHAESVVLPDSSPEEDVDRQKYLKEIDKLELGRKSPKEREEDVIKIVASVAEVLKSEAPLEELELEGKIPFYTTTELRETHITTVHSPIIESRVINSEVIPSIPEEVEVDLETKRASLIAESQELLAATSKIISDIKGKSDTPDQSATDESVTSLKEAAKKGTDEAKDVEDRAKIGKSFEETMQVSDVLPVDIKTDIETTKELLSQKGSDVALEAEIGESLQETMQVSDVKHVLLDDDQNTGAQTVDEKSSQKGTDVAHQAEIGESLTSLKETMQVSDVKNVLLDDKKTDAQPVDEKSSQKGADMVHQAEIGESLTSLKETMQVADVKNVLLDDDKKTDGQTVDDKSSDKDTDVSHQAEIGESLTSLKETMQASEVKNVLVDVDAKTDKIEEILNQNGFGQAKVVPDQAEISESLTSLKGTMQACDVKNVVLGDDIKSDTQAVKEVSDEKGTGETKVSDLRKASADLQQELRIAEEKDHKTSETAHSESKDTEVLKDDTTKSDHTKAENTEDKAKLTDAEEVQCDKTETGSKPDEKQIIITKEDINFQQETESFRKILGKEQDKHFDSKEKSAELPDEIRIDDTEGKDVVEEIDTVHRMLVTASSEDGGEETVICPEGTITFSKSSESSGRSSPELRQSQKSSVVDSISDTLSTVKQVQESVKESSKEIALGTSSALEDVKDKKEGVSVAETVEEDINKTGDAIKDSDQTVVEKKDKTLEELDGKVAEAIKPSEVTSETKETEKAKDIVSLPLEKSTNLITDSVIMTASDNKYKVDEKLSKDSSPAISGISTPVLSGKSTPDLGKHKPDLTETKHEDSTLSEKSTPNIDKIKTASEAVKMETPKSISPNLSGKATPELDYEKQSSTTLGTTNDISPSLSGKSTPDIDRTTKPVPDKVVSSKEATPTSSPVPEKIEPSENQSVESSLDHDKTEDKAPTKYDGKTVHDILETSKDVTSTLSGKSTPELVKPDNSDKLKSSKEVTPTVSGKSTPDLGKAGDSEIVVEKVNKLESSRGASPTLSGKSTPEVGKTIESVQEQHEHVILGTGDMDKPTLSETPTPEKVTKSKDEKDDLDKSVKNTEKAFEAFNEVILDEATSHEEIKEILDAKSEALTFENCGISTSIEDIIIKPEEPSDKKVYTKTVKSDAGITLEPLKDITDFGKESLDKDKKDVEDQTEQKEADVIIEERDLPNEPLKKEEFQLKAEVSKDEKSMEVDFKLEEATLQKDERQLEGKAKHLEETFEDVSKLSDSISFEKCKSPEKDVKVEEVSMKKEHSNPDTMSKPTEKEKNNEAEDEFKIKKDTLKKEEKQLEDKAKHLEDTLADVKHLSESITFETCKSPDKEVKIGEEIVKKEEKELEERVKHLEENLEDVEKLSESIIFDKCKSPDVVDKDTVEKEEKELEDRAQHIAETFEDVNKLAKSISFDKCKVSDDYNEEKHSKEASEKSEDTQKQIESKLKELKDTIHSVAEQIDDKILDTSEDFEEAVNKTTEGVQSKISETLGAVKTEVIDNKILENKEHDKELKKDVQNYPEKSDAPEKSFKDELKESSPKMDSDIKDILSNVTKDINVESIKAEFKDIKTEDNKEIPSDIKAETGAIKKIVEEISSEISTESIQAEFKNFEGAKDEKKESNIPEKCDKESMEKSSTLQPSHVEQKKLSISDISIQEQTCPKAASQMFIESESGGFLQTNYTDTNVFRVPTPEIKETLVSDSQPGPSSASLHTSSGTSTPDKIDKQSESLISGKETPPTAPVSPFGKESDSVITSSVEHEQLESDDEDLSTKSQVAQSQSDLEQSEEEFLKKSPSKIDPMSMSFYGELPVDETSAEGAEYPTYLYEITKAKYTSLDDETDIMLKKKDDLMTASFIGELPSAKVVDELKGEKTEDSGKKTDKDIQSDSKEEACSSATKDPIESWGKPLGLPAPSYLYEITKAKYTKTSPVKAKSEEVDLMTMSFYGALPEDDPIASWGKPLGLPSPAPPQNNSDKQGTPKKERKLPPNVTAKNKLNDDKKRADSPSKYKNKKVSPVYVDLTYVPHHGNAYYAYVDFFKRIRARYYVFSGIEPSRQVYDALLEAKQTWEEKDLEVTIIPTYDTDILGYWVAENEELLSKFKIDLSPSASRCTINLQDHETSCSAYRLEF